MMASLKVRILCSIGECLALALEARVPLGPAELVKCPDWTSTLKTSRAQRVACGSCCAPIVNLNKRKKRLPAQEFCVNIVSGRDRQIQTVRPRSRPM